MSKKNPTQRPDVVVPDLTGRRAVVTGAAGPHHDGGEPEGPPGVPRAQARILSC